MKSSFKSPIYGWVPLSSLQSESVSLLSNHKVNVEVPDPYCNASFARETPPHAQESPSGPVGWPRSSGIGRLILLGESRQNPILMSDG
jgi:hypothetical protein